MVDFREPCEFALILLPPFIRLMRLPATAEVVIDQCMYGLKDPVSGLLYRKRTKFIGNLPGLASLSVPCDRTHEHQHIEDAVVWEGRSIKRSVLAGRYPAALCQAIAGLVDSAQILSAQRRAERVRAALGPHL